MHPLQPHLTPFVTSALRRAGLDDWMPEGTGKWSLPLQFLPDGGGWVELMLLSPGARLGWHRHHGEVHALNLQGTRRLNDGRVIAAGDYVFEPEGNVDWWEAIGDEALLLHVVVRGDVDYVDPAGQVSLHIDTASRIADYEAHCAALGLPSRVLELSA